MSKPMQNIPAVLDRRPLILSYTMLNTYDNICPHQAFRKYIRKDIPYAETPAMAKGNAVHTAMELRIGGGKPLPLEMADYEKFAKPFDGRKVKAEEKLGVTAAGKATGFFDKDVYLRGKLDVNIVSGTSGYLGDFKTGKVREDPFELEIQSVLLHAKHPHLTKIVGQYFWLAEGKAGPLHDLSATVQVWDNVNKIASKIFMDKSRGEFEKRQGPLCKWCDCFDCEFNTNPRKP